MKPLYNTGDLTRPLLSVAGNWDCLIPFKYHAEGYASLVKAAGAEEYHRLYEIERGNHVDGLLTQHKGKQQPVHSYYEAALLYLEEWVEQGNKPPDSGSFESIENFYPFYNSLKTIQ